jgi:hypothetical protein
MATKGTVWVLRRSTDLVPSLVGMAIAEWRDSRAAPGPAEPPAEPAGPALLGPVLLGPVLLGPVLPVAGADGAVIELGPDPLVGPKDAEGGQPLAVGHAD